MSTPIRIARLLLRRRPRARPSAADASDASVPVTRLQPVNTATAQLQPLDGLPAEPPGQTPEASRRLFFLVLMARGLPDAG